jgi:hypothetical protein
MVTRTWLGRVQRGTGFAFSAPELRVHQRLLRGSCGGTGAPLRTKPGGIGFWQLHSPGAVNPRQDLMEAVIGDW